MHTDHVNEFLGLVFATGSYGPIMRLVAMLPWSRDLDSLDKLTLGHMAKYTLASNAARDMALLGMLKRVAKARNQDTATVAAVAGQVEFGIPCVIGGAVSTAALNNWNGQQ